jgi:YqaJ-like viral recombinase domain
MQVFETYAMREGKEREPQARRLYEYRTELQVEQVDFVTCERYPWAGCSPDGLIGTDGGIEIKCPQKAQHLANLMHIQANELPPKYREQVQGCMWVTGRQWWDFVTFNPEFPPHLEAGIIRVQRDEEYMNQLEALLIAFEAEVQEIYTTLNAMNGGPRPEPVRLPSLTTEHSAEYAHVTLTLLQRGEPLAALNDAFNPLSWLYQHSEQHEQSAFHIFRKGDEYTAVPASDGWVQEITR